MHDSTSSDSESNGRDPQSELQIFDNGEFNLEIIPAGDSFIVNAPGLARALGMRDAYRLTDSLPEDEKGYTLSCTPGGEQVIWHVTEPGLYRAIGQRQAARIKNDEMKQQVVRFQRWVYHDVLPSIRKTGQYGQAAIAVPRSFADALELAAKQAREIETKDLTIASQGRQLTAAGPKLAVYDDWLDPNNMVEPTDFAKRIGFRSAQELNGHLRDLGIMRRDKHPRTGKLRNLPTADWGHCFNVKPQRIPTGGFVDVAWILPEGQLEIVEELRNHGLIDF